MGTNKRYTNTAFTKRVDHPTASDSRGSLIEPSVCESCGAVYSKRRWTAKVDLKPSVGHGHWRPAQLTVCPGCKRIADGVPSGFVAIDGAFLAAHYDDIERLLKNEVKRAGKDNPLARIMEWNDREKNKLMITTTTEHLAQRLGHALEKAFDGEVIYDFSHENKLARVSWHRD
jgi:NMD protein affecting ribosome stability and mRNA decay